MTPLSGTVHEVAVDRLNVSRRVTAASSALGMALDREEQFLYVLAKDPRALLRIDAETLKVESRIDVPEEPSEFFLSPKGRYAAVSFRSGVRLLDLNSKMVSQPLASGEYGAVRFLEDGKTLIAANRAENRLSLFDVQSAKLLTHLPLSVRPDNLCFNQDGGQLFVTGAGMDGVVIVYPYHTPEVAETVLAGRAPGPMAASASLLFVASPESGDVVILNIPTRKMIAVVQVGSDPGFIAITPDDQYALVLNRKSGDVAVLRVATITANKYKTAALFTVIPVGSRPVSAAVRGV